MNYVRNYTKEKTASVLKEFEYFSNAPIFDIASNLSICDNYGELEKRLNLEDYFSFLICKN